MKKETGSEKTGTAYRTCPLCEATCGLEITLENGRVTGIRGDEQDVFSHGYFCPKGAALAGLHDDPDRLRRPLIRTDSGFREATWDEAFAEIEQRLLPLRKEHGPDVVAVYAGNPNVHTMAGMMYMKPLVKALGTKNVFSASTVDQIPKQVASGLLFGSPALVAVPDLDRTDYLLMLGANPYASNGSVCTAPDFPGRLKAIRERGGKVIVVDPVRTRTAQSADEHLPIRPCTDVYFLLAIVHTLFEENLTRPDRLADLAENFNEVKVLASPYSPEAVSGVCGIGADTIRRITRELADAPTAAVYARMGASTVPFGTMTNWLVDVIGFLTGNLDRPGGMLFPSPATVRPARKPGGKGFAIGRWKSRVKGYPEVMSEFPVATLADEIEMAGPGQVKALVTIAGNPVLTTPDSRRLDAALAALDFMVCIDFYLNESTRHAHVILPPTGPLTTGHYDLAFYGLSVHNVANYSPPVLEKPDDELDKWEIMARLALVVSGQGAAAPASALDDFVIQMAAGEHAGQIVPMLTGKGPERLLDLMLRSGQYGDGFGKNPDGLSLQKLLDHPHGIDLGPLRSQLPDILKTPSGKIDLAPAPVMDDRSRLADDFSRRREGLVLIGRRHLRSNNSWMHNIETLVKGKDRCTLQVHPDDAARLGLTDGGRARIASSVGEVTAPVEITDIIMPGVVSLPHGWGHDYPNARLAVAAEYQGVNSNILTDGSRLDAISGNAVLNGIPVEVTAA